MIFISVADNGSILRCEIIVIDQIKSKGIILDPTVSFEISTALLIRYDKKWKFTIQQLHFIKNIYKSKYFQVTIYLFALVEDFLNCFVIFGISIIYVKRCYSKS